jgi:hypothetical protein
MTKENGILICISVVSYLITLSQKPRSLLRFILVPFIPSIQILSALQYDITSFLTTTHNNFPMTYAAEKVLVNKPNDKTENLTCTFQLETMSEFLQAHPLD